MNFGLKKTEHDPRDYSYHKTFGSAAPLNLPDEYFAGRPPLKNQKLSQMCTAAAACVLAACEDNADFSFEWFFAAEKEISGTPRDQAEDLRTPVKTACKMGFVPVSPDLPSLDTKNPDYCSNIANYPVSTVMLATKYIKKSFFRVDGDFDTVRRVLWDNRMYHRAILTGVLWFNEWTSAPAGMVPNFAVSPAGLHCIAIIGFTKRFGIDYIVVQNSYGEQYGDRGLFYFDRQTFNENFNQPMYMLVDAGDASPAPIGNFLSVLFYNLKKSLWPQTGKM